LLLAQKHTPVARCAEALDLVQMLNTQREDTHMQQKLALWLIFAALFTGCGGTTTTPPTATPPSRSPAPTSAQPAAAATATLTSEEAILADMAVPPTKVPTAAPPPRTGLIEQISTDKAMYAPEQPVTIVVELHNRTGMPYEGQVALSFFHLGEEVTEQQAQPVEPLATDAAATLTFTWSPPAADFQGYLVEVQARDKAGTTTLDTAATAVDVSSDWRRFPRYGFVSRFDSQVDAADVIARLNRYHLNGIQFYDWQWQHHRPYSPDETWPDIAGRSIVRSVVNDLIDEAHRRNMLAMHYSLAFGAYDRYWADGSGAQVAWGLFTDGKGSYDPARQDFHPLPSGWSTGKLYLMNPGNPEWQEYIFGQQRQVFEHFAFDGWHIDTLGKRGDRWDWSAAPVDLAATYVPFTNNAKAALQRRVLFNAVGGYGQDEIAAGADVDFIYTELWEQDGTRTYADIVALAARARAKTDKALVFPAYMNRTAAQTAQGGSGFFNEASVRLAEAVIFAAGASHLELGDGNGMLSHEYFPSQKLVMSDSLKQAMVGYYDFLVAYENLLRDNVTSSLNPVAATSTPTSIDGQPGTVWALARARPGYTIVHLINLMTAKSNLWRDDLAVYSAPQVLTDLELKIYYTGELPAEARLWYASPDSDSGKALRLTYTAGRDDQGTFVACTVPRLEYWDMLWLEQ
jgi:dextranase